MTWALARAMAWWLHSREFPGECNSEPRGFDVAKKKTEGGVGWLGGAGWRGGGGWLGEAGNRLQPAGKGNEVTSKPTDFDMAWLRANPWRCFERETKKGEAGFGSGGSPILTLVQVGVFFREFFLGRDLEGNHQ